MTLRRSGQEDPSRGLGGARAPDPRESLRSASRARRSGTSTACVFDPVQYMRHPILLRDDWEVMIIGWEAGQVTPIHDHRGVLGGMVMLSGSLLEERFMTPGLALASSDTRVRPEGDLCDIGPTTLHRLIPTTRAGGLPPPLSPAPAHDGNLGRAGNDRDPGLGLRRRGGGPRARGGGDRPLDVKALKRPPRLARTTAHSRPTRREPVRPRAPPAPWLLPERPRGFSAAGREGSRMRRSGSSR